MANQPPYGPPQMGPPQAEKKKGMPTCLIVGLVLVALSIPMLGVMASLGIYGVRRYLVAAKTAEAKNSVGAISRAAVAAYERETLVDGKTVNRLCGSAAPVPTAVPAGKKYMPSAAPGADFNAGSAAAGWTCLRFAMTMPVYYQYHYQQGSGWVVPARAPGAQGFEVTAVGDLDGNGTTSTFSRTARISGGVVVVEPNLFIDNEFE